MTFFRGTSIHPGFIGGMRRRIKEKSDYQYHCRRIADRLFDDRIGETGADESGKPQQPQQTIQKLILAYIVKHGRQFPMSHKAQYCRYDKQYGQYDHGYLNRQRSWP